VDRGGRKKRREGRGRVEEELEKSISIELHGKFKGSFTVLVG